MNLLLHDLATALERAACDEAVEDGPAPDDFATRQPWTSTSSPWLRRPLGSPAYLPRRRSVSRID